MWVPTVRCSYLKDAVGANASCISSYNQCTPCVMTKGVKVTTLLSSES